MPPRRRRLTPASRVRFRTKAATKRRQGRCPDRLVEERGLQPLPLGITLHKLRHTFASILVAIGKAPTYVMQQLGHTDPAFTLRVYAHTTPQRGGAPVAQGARRRPRLGTHWAQNGRIALRSGPAGSRLERRNSRASRGFLLSGRPDLNRDIEVT